MINERIRLRGPLPKGYIDTYDRPWIEQRMHENSVAEFRQHDIAASPFEPFPRTRLRFCGFFFGGGCLFIGLFEFGIGHFLEGSLDFGSWMPL